MRLNQLRSFDSLAENQREVPLARELPYWDLAEDVMVLADGTLARGFSLKGLAIETLDADGLNRITEALRALLNGLPDGLDLSIVAETDNSFGPLIEAHSQLKSGNSPLDWVSEMRVNALRAEVEAQSLLRPTLALFIYRRFVDSGTGATGPLRSFFSTPKGFQDVRAKDHDVAVKDLNQTAESLRERFETIGIRAEPLRSDKIWALAYRFLNPGREKDHSAPKLNIEYRNQEFSPEELKRLPALSLASPREQLVFSDLIQRYDCFILDGIYHRCITLKTMPEFTHAALISRLMQLPFPQVLHTHVQVPEQSEELSKLQAKRRMAHSMSIAQGGRASDLESEARLASTEELLRELLTTGQKIFYLQLTLLIRAKTVEELESRTKTVLSTFRGLNGAEATAETVAGFKVWKTLLPLGTTTIVRSKRVKSDTLADFLPVYEPYAGPSLDQGTPVCLFRNRFQGLVSYDPFDPRLPNYNALVTGSSGSGKSFINNLVLLQYMSQQPLVYVIDIGGSYRKLTEFLGGQYIEISPPTEKGSGQTINPFDLADGSVEPSPQKIKFLLALLENMLTDTEGDRLPKLDKSLLEEAIILAYANARTTGSTPRLSDLKDLLAASQDQKLRDFARILYPWTGDRAYGRLLDGANTLNLAADLVVFDLKGLASYPDLQAVTLLIITDFILGRVESKEAGVSGRKKRILMDECWELLKSQASSHFMEYCVRTLRKTGSGITFITQGLEEIVASEIGSAILSNTATKLILMQRGDLEPIQKILKFNEQEMALISSLKQVKGRYSEALLVANDARTVIRACPTPVEYWLATSDAADNALLEEARRKQPERPLADHIHALASTYPYGAAGGRHA